jgi:hypothetical protein
VYEIGIFVTNKNSLINLKMKTIILKSADNSIKSEVKVDIFATTAELQVPGFDTRFTGMEIVDDEAAIVAGINVRNIEYNWQSLVALAQENDLSLFVIDLNGSESGPVEVVEAP